MISHLNLQFWTSMGTSHKISMHRACKGAAELVFACPALSQGRTPQRHTIAFLRMWWVQSHFQNMDSLYSWIRTNTIGVSLKGPAVAIFWGLTVYTLSPQKYGSQRKNTRIQYPVSGRAILTIIFKTGIMSPFLGMLTMFETTQQRLFGPIFHIFIAVFFLNAILRMVQVFFSMLFRPFWNQIQWRNRSPPRHS